MKKAPRGGPGTAPTPACSRESATGCVARLGLRDLAEEGTSFREVREAECLRRAAAALSRGETIDAIAAELGFAGAPAFTSAFRRWTGITLARWRMTGR